MKIKGKNYAAAALALPLIGASAAAAQQMSDTPAEKTSTADPSSPSVDQALVKLPADRDSGVLAESALSARVGQGTDQGNYARTDGNDDETAADTGDQAGDGASDDAAPKKVTTTTPPTTKATTSTTAAPATTAPPTTAAPTTTERTTTTVDNLTAYEAYWNAGYSYEQLLVLSAEWGLGQFEAKARAGRAILAGDRGVIDDLVGDIDYEYPDGTEEPNQDDVDAWEQRLDENPNYLEEQAFPEVTPEMSAAFVQYWNAGYTYSQLLVLADEWGVKEWEAKFRAGKAIQAGNRAEIDAVLAGA